LGAKELGHGHQKKKCCLILDKEDYRYQKFISDLSGNDIKSHRNNCKKIICCVRDWLSNFSRAGVMPGPGGSEIYRRFGDFMKALPEMCRQAPIKQSELTFNDYTQLITTWI